MTGLRPETVPTTWDAHRDDAFFRITARLFRPAFCAGASALLAGYDDDAPTPCAAPGRPRHDRADVRVLGVPSS